MAAEGVVELGGSGQEDLSAVAVFVGLGEEVAVLLGVACLCDTPHL